MYSHKRKKGPSVAQFQELVLLEKEESLKGFDRELRFAAIMKGLSPSQAEEELTMDEIMQINREFDFPDMSKVPPALPRRAWIAGRLFEIRPNFAALNFGDFVAFEHFTRTEATSVRELHNIMALLMKEIKLSNLWAPAKEKPEAYLERAAFLQANGPAWLGCQIAGFFTEVWKELCGPTSKQPGGSRWIEILRVYQKARQLRERKRSRS